MKRILSLLLAVCLCGALCGCGAGRVKAGGSAGDDDPAGQIFEVRITLDNLYDYFEYKEYATSVKEDDGHTSSVQISYGLALKEIYTAANSPDHHDTMTITFSADGVVNRGDFTVDFNTLQFTGTIEDTEVNPITETLSFWPKGDRTTTWAYGNYGSTYIMYLENFRVTSASGVVYLRSAA